MNEWNLYVENFGKIDKAEIAVRPFTLFIGDNNSNKSYMMSLIYGIINLDLINNPLYKFEKDDDDYIVCKKWFKEIEYANKIDLTKREFYSLNKLLNKLLNKNKNMFIKSIFNEKIEIEKINVEFKYISKISLAKQEVNDEKRYILSIGETDITFDEIIYKNNDLLIKLLLQAIIRSTYNADIMGKKVGYYLPTSRTGFLLTRKTLVKSSIEDKFNEGMSEKNLLIRPCSDFLSEISSISIKELNEQFKDIVKLIENEIIEGSVKVDSITNEIMYLPEGGNEAMPMFISSGVITEITPLILMLKYQKGIKALMIEEPEMCLHPKLQCLIAKVMIRIVNKKLPVLLTTHSDNILQYINNMIKLNNNSNKKELMKKYNYEEQDIISSDKIAMYQFDVHNHKTSINKLECGDYGFEAETFNNMLIKLLKESRAFNMEE